MTATRLKTIYAFGLFAFGFGLNFFPVNGLGAVTQLLGHPSAARSDVDTVGLGEAFPLKIGQQVTLQNTGLTIKFTKILADSRCPSGAQYVWAGEAKILVEVKTSTTVATPWTLTLRDREQSGQLFAQFRIQFLGLEPDPVLNPQPDHSVADVAVATLLVNRS